MSETKMERPTRRPRPQSNANQQTKKQKQKQSIIQFPSTKIGPKIGNMLKRVEKKAEPAKKKELPPPRLQVSLGTLMEIEKWAERARQGTDRGTFGPVADQIRYNGDVLDDAVHSLTLAQIMPYKEMKRHLRTHDLNPAADDYEFTYGLAQRYKTKQENVVERIHHVRMISRFLAEHKKQHNQEYPLSNNDA